MDHKDLNNREYFKDMPWWHILLGLVEFLLWLVIIYLTISAVLC